MLILALDASASPASAALLEDGRIIEASDAGMLFPKAGTLFSSSLRTVTLFLPDYIDDRDAENAFRMVDNG